MSASHPSSATGLRSVLGLGLSLLTIVLLHGVASSTGAGEALWGSSAGRRADEVLVVLLAWVGMALASWLALGSALALLSTIPGSLGRWCGRLAEQLTPLLVRRVLTVALGTSTVSLGLPPASVVGTVAAPTRVGPALVADPDPFQGAAEASGRGRAESSWAHEPGAGTPVADGSVPGAAIPASAGSMSGPGYAPTEDVGPGYRPTSESPGEQATTPDGADGADGAAPGFRPTRPVPAHDRAGSSLLAPPPRPEVAAHDTVTVRRGDNLWSIAARHLGASASDAQIARVWPQWHAANRAVIGDDPDLIRPGMQLVPPREGDLP
jgi:nucleoid-associated protein YgaU